MAEEIMMLQISTEDIYRFEQALYEKENAAATIQKYKTDVRTLFRFLENERVINKRKLLEYKEWLLERYAISSVNSILAALNQFLEFLGVANLKVKRIKVQRIKVQRNLFLQEEKELSKQDFQRLLSAARSGGKYQLALCMETIAATGIRISELKYFTLENVKQGRIEIFNKGKYRKIFLPHVIRMKLLSYCKQQKIKSGYIFRTRSGKSKDRSNIWSEMKALKEKTGIDGAKIFPHNLRHLFARNYYQYTKDLAGLADLLGHSSLNVTRIYTSNTGEVYQRQLDNMVEADLGKNT